MPDKEGHPEFDEITLDKVLIALANPLRLKIVATLSREPDGTERYCASFRLPVTKASRTHHFRILREAGLIRQVDRGNSRMAHLRRGDISRRFPGLLEAILDAGSR
jgi:DNA-binding transcriptional ArsR family regulator